MRSASEGRASERLDWSRLADDELLDLRPSELGLTIRGSPLERSIRRLRRELSERGLVFRPHCWLSSDWFSPSGVPGIAIPFYLSHPRLRALEEAQMNELEGGTEAECLRLLRHEAGHAVDTAYRLHLRRSWRATFGRFSDPYQRTYSADPASRDHVHNLDRWYAQSHPAEDFAETFAVWLAADWRAEYAGWPALAKLEYVDGVMRAIAAQPAVVTCRERTEPVGSLRQTLRRWYARRAARAHAFPGPGEAYDEELRRVFPSAAAGDLRLPAAGWVRARHEKLRETVAERSDAARYTLDQVLRDLALRCRQLDLVVEPGPEVQDEFVRALLRSLELLRNTRPVMSR